MKILLVIVLCLVSVRCGGSPRGMEDDPFVITQGEIDYINSVQDDWVAGMNVYFAGKRLSDVKSTMFGRSGASIPSGRPPTKRRTKKTTNVKLPDEFETYEKWPYCKNPIRDQGPCGSAWCMAIAIVMTDRFCISTKGEKNVTLSTQDWISCERDCYGCQGGYTDRAWKYLEEEGAVTIECFPYVPDPVAPCKVRAGKCADESVPFKKYHAVAGSSKQFASKEDAMESMTTKGPVEASFDMYTDFFAYKSGVYHHVNGTSVFPHQVKVLGWGVEKGVDYWNVANIWGPAWGDHILRGTNECKFESYLWAADPLID